MSTPREIFLEMLKPDGRPERILDQYEALAMMTGDPINAYLRGNRVRGTTSVDKWGTTILFPADAPGPMPDTRDELKVLRDITHWRDYVHAPDLEANCSAGWEDVRAKAEAVRGEKLVAGFMGTGIFEQCHFLMGFEDTLSNLYEHPDEMHELIDYITDYRLKYVQMLIDNLHPDVIFSHDDWGTKNALFMKPEMWREFYKEPYRRFYGYIREHGVIAIHHGDAYLADIVEDMAELGIQCWQGVLPENNIPALQERLGGRMILMGGIGAAIDRADATEAEIIRAAKEAHSWEFIERLPQGLNTVLHEDSISQGQKQLLCITRVMLCRPPMLILDEATSSIDTRTELQVQAAFDKLMQGRTSFVVAHRLSTVRNASLILVMRDGRIVEQGRHEELLQKGGFYSALYNSQFQPS